MAKKDKLLNNENNETEVVSEDTSLEKKDVEELQAELSSIFNEDYNENEENEDWEEFLERPPLLPFLGKRERYGYYNDFIEEKKPKKKSFPWSKKSQETEETPEEAETPVEEIEESPKEKKSVFSWKKKSGKVVDEKEESAQENVKPEIVEDKEEVKPDNEDEKITQNEIADESPVQDEVAEEPEEIIEELSPFEENEDIIEELPPFQVEQEETVEEVVEESEEVIEELSPFEVEQEEITEEVVEKPEEVMEELPAFEENAEVIEELPPFEATETETTDETVAVEEIAEENHPKKRKKKVKEEKVQSGDSEPLTKKDHLTFVLALVALVLAVAFVCIKFFPINNNGENSPENNVETTAKLAKIQVVRQGTNDKYIQSDIENVYYSFSSENEVKYYEYENNGMKPLQATGTVDAQVSMDKKNLPVKIDYVRTDNGIFGISIFRSEDNPGSTIHNVITFKLVNLPEKHNAEGKALLLAVANSESVSRRYNLWTDSFIVDLNTGTSTRFLTADKNSNSYSVAYSVLTNSACATDGEMIPFFTTRAYGEGGGKKDLFVKNGANESLFATDVYGEYIYADKDVIAYLKMTATGFDVVKKENTKEEKIVFSLYGSFGADYLYHQEYILDKFNGNLYNAKTGEEIALAGYKMSNAEMMSVSPDGRCLVVLGTVNSVADYQVHVFDLEKNDYAKYEDLNFSQHYNLAFADDTKVMYVAVDPNQGYEHVILDVSKAF